MFALSFSFGAILKFVWSVAGTAILGGLTALIGKALQAIHINISATQRDEFVSVVQDAIHYAEELDATSKKDGGAGFGPQAKLQIATKYVVDRGIKGVTPEQIAQVIKAILPQVGLGASGK